MKSKVETVEKNVVKLTIEEDAERFNESLKKAYQKTKGRFTVPGFRRGKAPMSLIEKYYGENVFFEEALNIICPEAYEAAIKEHGIIPVDTPELDIEQIGKDKNLIFTAKVTVKPEVKLGQYKGLDVEKEQVNITDEDVQKELEKIRDRNARLVTVEDRPVQQNDIVNIDFEGFIDGKPFDGGSAKGYTLVIGSNTFIPGFEEQLVGAALNQEVEVNVTFPEDYHNESLKGKQAVFKVRINEIKYKELPNLDDEFAQDISEFNTLEEYKADLRKKLEERAQQEAERKYENELVKKAVENAEVDIPEVMVERQINNILQRMDVALAYQGLNLKTYMEIMGIDEKKMRDDYRERALEEVKTELVLEKIAQTENIQATDEEVEKEIAEMAERYKQNPEDFKKHLQNDDIEYIKETIVRRKTIELLKQ
ncbi:trigger factor Tig [Thermoclostridium stercorarium subsp. stercorarium DSM 8532]|uniref:Trigger factor n=2 Tax=Thermoclostridium stercorarium TaxID=1510 RepID=L7VS19_THES1|nr:trigger factor [Thermoclostridium stercorarium]AGC69449.1 trigger factor Tig [Thermoclostridium stercorarium subsp. stercorarium DSM 8532]AGI40408.1 trigger factor [Thermoclostridium stercorarium subsp. stercorarium DSM 8532]ANW99696.1 trigger factor [Thermoclostridium stercorarium subsp. thermolacticum DSM 2910]